MNEELKKLQNFVVRNEAYIKSATWLSEEIYKITQTYDEYMKTGVLPAGYSSAEDLFDKMKELDSRAGVEAEIYVKLSEEQNNFLN